MGWRSYRSSSRARLYQLTGGRQGGGERGADSLAVGAFGVGRGEGAARAFDDSLADGETEAGAFAGLFGGEEWVEDAGENVVRNAGAAIGDGDSHGVGAFAPFGDDLDLDADCCVGALAARGDGVGGIQQEIEQYLGQSVG